MNFRDSASRFWGARSDRERAYLLVAAIAVLAATLYAFLLEPGLAARKQLSAALPRLRAQADDMRQQQKEIVALRKKIGSTPQRTDLKALLQSSIARTPFAGSVERIEAAAGERVLFLAAPVAFDEWMGWVEQLQNGLGVRLDACKVVALDQPGMVRIEATFVAAGQDPAAKAR